MTVTCRGDQEGFHGQTLAPCGAKEIPVGSHKGERGVAVFSELHLGDDCSGELHSVIGAEAVPKYEHHRLIDYCAVNLLIRALASRKYSLKALIPAVPG